MQQWKKTVEYKGIILAGGSGKRLYPITDGTVKQLLPVYDKPLIYYPLSVLMLADIRDILIITNEKDLPAFKALLGTGERFGLNLTFAIQNEPAGIAEALLIGESFIAGRQVCLILGDNIFYGQGFLDKLNLAMANNTGATIFGYQVKEPGRFGVIEFNENWDVVSLEEKPLKPKSRFVATGLYFFNNEVVEVARSIKPSQRGELEITDVNRCYLASKNLKVQVLGRGFAWLDAGTPDSLLKASQFVQTIEERQGFKMACLEEIAFRKHWITKPQLLEMGKKLEFCEYGKYLLGVASEA